MPQTRAKRLASLSQSEIRRMSRECHKVGGINLGQGICDLPTPDLVREATIQAIRDDLSVYSYPEGILPLREAIADKLKRHNGITADPLSEIVVTVGASGAYTAVLQALLDPGDGVILFEPYYGYHANAAVVAGVEPQFVPLQPPEFALNMDALERAIKPNTRAVVICTPCNPSGKMFAQPELEQLAQIAERHDLLVITDEIYEYIRFDDRPHISPATVGDLRKRTVTIMGMSKTFSITGWRLGYAVAPPAMAEAIKIVNDIICVCAPTPLQHGVTAGFSAPESFFSDLASDYQRKRDMICGALKQAGLPPVVPQGAYYVLADVRSLDYPDARAAAMGILERSKVSTIPGSAFFEDSDIGNRYVRLCFAKDDETLGQACEQLQTLR